MISIAAIVLGYAALIINFGWTGVGAVLAHGVLMAAFSYRRP